MKISIFTSCHKDTAAYRSEIVHPIQVGTAINGANRSFTLRDNDGINISDKNRMYCELTAQYWAWKNVTADYYGFMHYRRYFSFSDNKLKEDVYGNIIFSRITDDALAQLGYSDDRIEKAIAGYDVIAVAPQNVSDLSPAKSVYEHYKLSEYHRIEDLDTVVAIINEKYPEYSQAAKKYLSGKMGYFCNMYILSAEIFERYNTWLFDILAEHERRTDLYDYDINEYRVSGFLAERLWGIFYTKLKQDNEIKYKEIQKSYFVNTQPDPDIQPAFGSNNIPIVIAADDKYVPYVTVMLRSAIENASAQYNYDFIVLHSSISKKHQQNIHEEFANCSNMSIRFFDIAYMYSGIKLNAHFHITVETYYRLLMQDIMKRYEKVLYIDSDLVVLGDLAELYNTDVSGYCLAAVKDIDMAGNYHGKDPSRKDYFKKTLTISNPYNYVNAGVLVMNLAEFRKQFTARDIIDTIELHDWLYMDQDILNYLCDGKIKHLDMSWNVVMNWQNESGSRMEVMRCAPHDIFLDYMESRKHPKIAHYAGCQKPWDVPECDMAEHFWKYAEMTGVYRELKDRLLPAPVYAAQGAAPLAVQNSGDPYQLHVNGLDESIYIDGLYIKLINKLNKWFPKNSKKRERLKRFIKLFIH